MSIEKWRWLGLPGHFCASSKCIFRLCTIVEDKMISTVGGYYPDGVAQMEEIGFGRHYETYVFNIDKLGKIKNFNEIDSGGVLCDDFDNPEKFDLIAEKMHIDFCHKYDKE